MKLFSEKVKHTLTNSSLNILQVEAFEEIFFGVFEIEINKSKYPVEKISEHDGNPVVSVPVTVEGVKRDYPFVLSQGKFEVLFNENNKLNDHYEIVDETVVDVFLTEISEEVEEKINIPEIVDNKSKILKHIQKAKSDAQLALKLEKAKNLRDIQEETSKKNKLLKNTLEIARENLVEEFVSISKKIRKEIIDENDARFDEIRECIDLKIDDLASTLSDSLKEDFKKSSKFFDNSIKELIKESYNSLQPKIDEELRGIATDIVEKVNSIEKELDKKLDDKVDKTILENVEGELNSVVKANLDLNDKINKGVNKALSRVGNVDAKVNELTIALSEEVENKILKSEENISNYYTEKLRMLEEKTFDITEETRKYIIDLVTESRNNLISEIREIKNEKPIEYIIESKGKKKNINSDDLIKDFDKKINTKIDNEVTRLRRYISVYSGGGSVAMQFADGGTMNGDLNVNGNISLNGVNLYDIFGGGGSGGGGSDVSTLSANWENTYTTVQANSATWGIGGTGSGSDVSTLSANWQNTYIQVNSLSSNWDYQGTDLKALSANWENTYFQVSSLSSGWDNSNITNENINNAITLSANATRNILGLGDIATTTISSYATSTQGQLASTTANTGIITGGVISINEGDPTKINISEGSGYVVDDTVSPPAVTLVEWETLSAITLTDLATATSTDIAINSGGLILQQRSYTNSELRSVIFLGGVDHSGGIINNTFSVQIPSFAAGLSVRDLARAVGDLNISGNVFSAASTNLSIAKGVGQSFSFGRNTTTDKTNPHIINQIAVSPATFNYIFQNGSGGTTVSAPTSSINPLNYDNGTGTLATVAVNDFSFHNVLFFPNANKTFIQYGTTTYNRLDDAINGLATTTFPTLVGFGSAMRRSVIIVQRGTTNLSDTTKARFFTADKFGSIAGSVGTGVAPDLSVYVPYTGATTNVNLGSNTLSAGAGKYTDDVLIASTANTPVFIGKAGGLPSYSGVWFTGASPTSSNYAFLSNGGNTFLNTPVGTNFYNRVNNNDRLTIGVNGVLVNGVQDSPPTHAFEVLATPGGTSTLVVNSNVGVGTVSPSEKLSVVSGDNLSTTDIITAKANNLTAGFAMTYYGIRQTGSGQRLTIDANGSGPILIGGVSSGNVGFGSLNLSPGSKISVLGEISVGGNYYTTAAPTGGMIIEGDVGIGTTSPSARLHMISTTEQLRSGYDISNYWNATTSSTGVTTFNCVGSGAKFVFSDPVDVAGNLNLTTGQYLSGGVSLNDIIVQTYIGGTNTLSIVAGAVVVNATNGRSQKITLTADVTSFGVPTNLADGQSMSIVGKQDGTGGRAFSLAAGYVIMGGGLEADISSLTANKRFILAIIRDGSDYLITITTQP